MTEELIAANRAFAASFAAGHLTSQARKGLAVLTCMDTRIDPLSVLGLSIGDAKVLRNAGARVTDDVLRSLLLATAFLGVERVVVLHHTNCALAGVDDGEVRARLAERGTQDVPAQLHAMPDPDAALRADVAAILACSSLPVGLAVHGWRYDVETGLLKTVLEEATKRA